MPNREKLEEKLLVASVSNATIITKNGDNDGDITENLNEDFASGNDSINEPLLKKSQFRGYPRTLGPPKNDMLAFSGSDCEINWILLLIAILLCAFIVPLIYVYFVYEHPEFFNHTHSRYDDTDLHFRAHIDDNLVHTTDLNQNHH